MVRHRIVLTLISLLPGTVAFAQLPALPAGIPDVKCPDLVAQARAANEVDHLPPITGDGSKGSPLTSLALVIKTSSDPLSGSGDDLWLDVGPRAWKVGNDFPGGSTKIFQFDLSTPDPAIDIPGLVQLTVGDITELRLDKKGLCGMTNAPDSIAAMLLPSVPKPEDLVNAAQKQVELTQYALDRQQALLNVAQGSLDHATSALVDANKKLADAEKSISSVPGMIADVQNKLVDAQKQILGIPQTVVHQVCSNTVTKIGVCIFNPAACLVTQVVCHNETTVNSVWQNLTNTITGLQQQKNNLEAQLQSAGIQKAAALQEITVETGLKAQAEAQKAVLQTQYQAAQQALTVAKQGLDEAKKIAAKIPWLPDFPKPGELKIESVRLIANGREVANFSVNDRLKQGHPTWSHPLANLSPAEAYVQHLRVDLNHASSWTDEEASSVTTIFKIAGVSGWEGEPVQAARVVGKLMNPPSPGADGYVSLDLQLERVEASNQGFVLDGNNGIPHTRYIRIEYKHLGADGKDDERYKSWTVGQRFAIEGPAFRDTDRWEFSELHPTVPGQLTPLQPNESGATPGLVLFFRRLISH